MQKLFTDFAPTTAADWKNQLIKDLKGEPYENLVWKNENGFDIQPFYTAESLTKNYEPAFTHSDWDVCSHEKNNNSKELNAQLLQDLNRGASSISINAEEIDFEIALKDIQLNFIQSTYYLNEANANALKIYLEKHYNLKDLNIALFSKNLSSQTDLDNWQKVVYSFKDFKNIKTNSANILPFHNQNCLAYYEVAIALSLLNEYLQTFKPEKEQTKFVIKTGVNSDYFIQISKLRAIHRCWKVLREEYNLNTDLHLIIETSLTNKSISDKYNNLLRTTVEAMAAIAGGCNELIVTEFDVLFPENEKLSSRMAINQQLILKDESYLNSMADISCGSYYIESITDAIAIKAIETFKRFEKEGGYFKCLEKNIFSQEIDIQSKHRNELFKEGKQLAIGVNKFKNEKENITISKEKIEELKHLPINNAILNFELENFFK
ncbi:MAG: methylmalonyl-CoA mutase family protein [Bacteroidota bacterium]|nr:methylmalonyl-CoA mutase family protein [Bacteroidota bacterium]